jgi:cation-transporting ATPase 13A2
MNSVKLFKYKKYMRILHYVLNVATISLFQFLMDKPRFRRVFLFKRATEEEFDYIQVKCKKSGKLFFCKVATETISVDGCEFEAKTFNFNKARFFLNPKNIFQPIEIKFKLVGLPHSRILELGKKGLDSNQLFLMESTFRLNKLEIKVLKTYQILKREIFSFIYYFQIFSIILWCLDDYYWFCILLILMTALSLYFVVRETKDQMNKIRDKLVAPDSVMVFRTVNGSMESSTVQSSHIFPGDLVSVSKGMTVPADLILIKGECLVNESALSGESRLIAKAPINNDQEEFSEYDMGHILFAGSKVEDLLENRLVLGLVWRSGFSTLNGKMIKSVLNPSTDKAQIEKDLSWFLVIMILMGVLGSVGYLICELVFIKNTVALSKVIFRSLELITILVPAFLPLCLSQSNYYGMRRMEKQKIVCTDHKQLNISGSIKSVFFDKTGTITNKHLGLKFCVEFGNENTTREFEPEQASLLSADYRRILGTCHALCKLTRCKWSCDRRR